VSSLSSFLLLVCGGRWASSLWFVAEMDMRGFARGEGTVGQGSHGGTSSVRRIQRELKEISESPSKHWTASPAEDDLYEWQFAVRGPPGTDFEGGIYTGRIALPVNYPLAPPSIILLTPNGRWEVGKKICLSNSSYHPELWQPAWGLRTMIEALRSHFPMPGDGAVGALDWPSDIRRRLAKESLSFVCQPGGRPNRELLPELTAEEAKEDVPEPAPQSPLPPQTTETEETQPPASTGDGDQLEGEAELCAEAEAAAAAGAADALQAEAVEQGGLRQRRGQPPAPGPAAAASPPSGFVQEPPAMSPPVPEAASLPPAAAPAAAAAAEEEGSSLAPRRRRQDSSRPARRQRPLLVQLLKPPQSRNEVLLFGVDVLLLALSSSALFIMVDLVRNPVNLLDPVPK